MPRAISRKIKAEETLNLPANRGTRDRAQFLNDLFLRKAFSWTKLFEDLEQVMPPRLHVVSIRPERTLDNQLEIKIVVAGESRDRAIELVKQDGNLATVSANPDRAGIERHRPDTRRQCAI